MRNKTNSKVNYMLYTVVIPHLDTANPDVLVPVEVFCNADKQSDECRCALEMCGEPEKRKRTKHNTST